MLALIFWSGSFGWLLVTTLCALWQPRRRRPHQAVPEQPVSVVVPTSAVASPTSAEDRRRTLTSLLDVQYSDFEIIVSVDRVSEEGEAVRRGVERGFGAKGVRTVAAEGEMSPNAKIDAMQAGLAEAENDVVLFCDDDVVVDPRHLQNLVYHLGVNAKLVSAAAIGVGASNFWGHLECSFMNGQFTRLHLAGDCLGFSGALGKTVLASRTELMKAGGLAPAAADCCEDAALTRCIKKANGQVVLSAVPVVQPIGHQKLLDVLRRHRRWLSCRRKYLPLVFVAEALFSSIIAVVTGAFATDYLLGMPLLGVLGTLVLWCAADTVFAGVHGYLTPATPAAWLLRELAFGPLWFSALFARTVTWYGRRVPVSG
jgi:cellulose synthase/poly-beta-1,6-N-acetylglucosamine synthase-like glycosyltransferase